MTMIDFLILYEVHVREFESIILLGNELKHRGYSVEYLGFEDCMRGDHVKNIRKIKKKYFNKVHTVLMPSLYHDKELFSIAYYVCGKCANVVNLRWEQYFTNANMKNTDGYLYPHGGAKRAFHMCWGQRSYENLIEAGVDESKLLLTGPLQMDLLRPEYADYYYSKEELYERYGFDQSMRSALFISSFAGATMTEHQYATLKKDFDGAYQKSEDRAARTRRAYEEALLWIEEFLQNNKDVLFIYRPHPTENISGALEKLQREYPNFKVISDHSVKQWIVTCDVVVTWMSTSIVEAFFANKPCFIIRPVHIPHEDDMGIYEGVKFITQKAEFLNIMKDECRVPVNAELMYYHYNVLEEKSCSARLADRLSELYNDENARFEWDEELVREFEKGRGKLFRMSVAYQIYRFFLRIFAAVNRATGITFGKLWKDRIQAYNAARHKHRYEKNNQNSFEDIYGRLTPHWEKSKKS